MKRSGYQMKRNRHGPDLSTRASRDGHEFHEAWAARKALKLVFPTDQFVGMAVESLSPADQKSASAASIEIADLVLYYGKAASFEDAHRIVVLQFKYSVARSAVPFGHSDANDTLKKFADSYRDHKKRHGKAKTDRKLRFELVTNRPISPALSDALKAAVSGKRPPPNLKAAVGKLQAATGLDGAELAEFACKLTATGSTGSLGETKQELVRTVTDWSRGPDATAMARLGALRQLVRDKAGTKGSGRNVIRRTDIFSVLGVQDEEELLPTPSAFPEIGVVVEREQLKEIAKTIPTLKRPLLIHATGGVGKTVLMSSLASLLARKHKTLTFDCFGAGQYRAPEDARHLPNRGLLHVINSLAVEGLCDPMLPDSENLPETIRASRRRLEQAVATIRRASPKSLLLLFLDAIDNSAIIARDRTEESFPKLLLESFQANGLPEGVKLIVSCRTERRDLAKGSVKCDERELKAFSRPEARQYLLARIPTITDTEVKVAYARSGGNGRILEYLARAGTRLLDASEIGNTIGVTDLLKDQIRSALSEAMNRGYTDADVAAFLAGLSVLPPPVPVAEYADAHGMDVSAIESFAADLFPLIEQTRHGLVFRDEPTETYIRETYAANPGTLKTVADNLYKKQDQSVYAASALPYLLQAIGDAQKLFALAFDDRFPSAITSEVGRRNIRDARLKAAVRYAGHRGDCDQLVRLLVELSTIAAVNQRGVELLIDHPALVVLSRDPDALRRLFQARTKWPGTRHARIAIANVLSGALDDAFRHIASASEWIYHYKTLDERERMQATGPVALDIAAVLLCLIAQGRPKDAVKYVGGYFDWFAYEVSELLFELVDQAASSGGITQNTVDSFLDELDMEMGLLTGAVSSGSITAKRRIQLVRKLATAAKRKKELRSSGRVSSEDGIISGLHRAAAVAALGGLLNETKAILALTRREPPSVWSYVDRYSQGHGASHVIDVALNALAGEVPLSERDLLPREFVELSAGVSVKLKGAYYRKALVARLEKKFKEESERDRNKEENDRRGMSYDTKRDIERFVNARFERLAKLADSFHRALKAAKGKADIPFLKLVSVWSELGEHKDEYTDQQNGSLGFDLTGLRLVLFVLRAREDLKQNSVQKFVSGLPGRRSVTDSALIELCSILSTRPSLHAIAGQVAKKARERIEIEDYVDHRASGFALLAHAIRPASDEEARSYFKLGIEQLDAIGAGDYQFTNELLLFASSLQGQELSASEAHTLSNICELNMRSEEHKFPWLAFAKGMGAVAGLPMLAKLGRWHDRDKISLAYTLQPFLAALMSRKKLGPEKALALMQLADPVEWFNFDTGDFGKALQAHGYQNEKPLLEELIAQFLENNGDGIPPRSAAEKLRELSLAVLGQDAPESQYLQWAAPRADALIDEQNDNRNYHGSADRLNTRSPEEIEAERRKKRAALKRIAKKTNPANERSLANAIEAMNELDGVYDVKGDFFADLRKKVRYGDRNAYVENVARLNSLLVYWKFEELKQCKAEWLGTTASLAETLRGLSLPLLQGNIEDLVSDDSFSGSLLKDISELTGTPMADLAMEVVKLFARPEAHFSAAVWLALGSILLWKADHAEGLLALKRLLHGATVRLTEMVADGPFKDGIYPPPDEVKVCSGLVWLQLASPASKDRWRASHSLRCFARLGQWGVLDEIVGNMNATDGGAFHAKELPFYFMHARMWLLIALARIATDYPERVARYEGVLKGVALNTAEPHVVIRHFAREALLTCHRAGHLPLQAVEVKQLIGLNVSPFGKPRKAPRQGLNYYQGRPPGASAPADEFHLEHDFEKETVNDLSRVFGLSYWQVSDVVSACARKFDTTVKTMYDSGGRSSATSRRQVGLISEYHGYGQQLGWHAVWIAAGELLATRPIVIPEYSSSNENPWPHWLKRYLLTRLDGLWLSDGTDYVPEETQVNLLEKGPEHLVLTGDKVKLTALLGVGKKLEEHVVVRGDWRSADGVRVAVSSALVKPSEASARMRELVDSDPFRAWLPVLDQREGEDEWGSNERQGYEPWLVSPSDEVSLDQDDPLCARSDVVRRPYFAKAIKKLLSVTSTDGFRRKWVDSQGRFAAYAEAWGRENPYAEDGSGAGKRLVVSVPTLQRVLLTTDRELLILVSIERYESSRHSSRPRDGFTHSIAVCRITPRLELDVSVGKINHRTEM